MTKAKNNTNSNNLYLTFTSGYIGTDGPNIISHQVNEWVYRNLHIINKNMGVFAIDFIDEMMARYFIQNNFPVPIKEEIDHGQWGNAYQVQFPFATSGKTFFYGHNLENKSWFIQELLHNGNMGDEICHGKWGNAYQVQFPFAVGGKAYFYGQSMEKKNWFVQCINNDGTIGPEIQFAYWNLEYELQFPFSVNNEQYFYGQNMTNFKWFIQKINI